MTALPRASERLRNVQLLIAARSQHIVCPPVNRAVPSRVLLTNVLGCINTIITMDSPDPDYGKTQAQAPGVTTSGFGTSDGGKTWAVDRISIPQFTFT